MNEPAAPAVRHPRFSRLVEQAGHPLILACAGLAWWHAGRHDGTTLAVLVAVLSLTALLEALIPAMPQWRVGVGARARLIAVYLLGLVVSTALIAAYQGLLVPTLADVRAQVGMLAWPHGWPKPAQALLLYFLSDLLYYWAHRAIHRWPALWRLTGYGFHHGFQNLHAMNAGANRPFELVVLVLPLILLAAATGAAGEAVGLAGVLLLTNATLVHANVRMDTPLFNLLVTSSSQHRRHHSAVFADSNTNYACNAILWDRLFGTFSHGPVTQTGIGPTQPPLWQMFLLPWREPADADTVASRRQATPPST